MAKVVSIYKRSVAAILLLSPLLSCSEKGIVPVVIEKKESKEQVQSPSPSIPPAGSSIDVKFWQEFMKPYPIKQGVQWRYDGESIFIGILSGKLDTKVASDILSVSSEGKVTGTIKLDITNTANFMLYLLPSTINTSIAPTYLNEYKSDGPEDITVEASTFKGAARVTRTDKDVKYIEWYYPGVGLLKSIRESSGTTYIDRGTIKLVSYSTSETPPPSTSPISSPTSSLSPSPSYFVSTVAGSGISGNSDGIGSLASFTTPRGITTDINGNIFVADVNGNRIRKITPDGTVTTVAGNNNQGLINGIGTSAQFRLPTGIVVDSSGNLFVADDGNHCIRKITLSGIVTTFAGNGTRGFSSGVGQDSMFNNPSGIAIDNNDNLYVSDYSNNLIRKITPQAVVTVLAGGGSIGFSDGVASNAYFKYPYGIAVDKNGIVYVADSGNHSIRKITPDRVVTTIAGNGASGYTDGVVSQAKFFVPIGIAIDNNNNIFVAELNNARVRKITPDGFVTTFAGNGQVGFVDGEASIAKLTPSGIAIDKNGIFYIADDNNARIRKIELK